MSAYNNRGGPGNYDNHYGRYGNVQPHDVANWGYIILYLIVILVSLVGNGLFLFTIKKNPGLRRTPHFMLASLAARDLIVSILVVPFVIDSQVVNLLRWKAGSVLCKFYSFLNHGTIATHAFTLVFLATFLYFWYRKQESYVTEDGQTIVRQTRMHKWAIPLAWVIGLGLAIPAGALSSTELHSSTGTQTCAVWNGYGNSSDGYKAAVSMVFVTFFLPLVLVIFPFIALTMQFFKCREPRLDPPHNRTALTVVLLTVVFIGTMAPFQIYQAMKLFHQSSAGLKMNPTWGTPYEAWTFNTDIILNAIVYVSCAIHPILYFTVNPAYRAGLRVVWRELYCNKDPAQREREAESKRQQRAMQRQQYAASSRPGSGAGRPIIRGSGAPLLKSPQPQIMMAPMGAPHNQFYAPPGSQTGTLQPLLPQGGGHILFPDQHFIDTSFESAMGSTVGGATSPQLPPVFEYNGLKYIDTARVEPKIAYSPEKTPPKTPETPHFGIKPFRDPLDAVPINPEAFVMASPIPPSTALPHMDCHEISPPIATSEPKSKRPSSMTLEQLDSSPGNTLRDRHRRGTGSGSAGLNTSTSPPISPVASPQPVVEMLTESPGNKKRQRLTHLPQSEGGSEV